MKRFLLLTASILCATAVSARADVITKWNDVLHAAVRATSTNPPKASRAMAILNIAMFEAVNGIDGAYERYHVVGTPQPWASIDAAAATAAHRVLSNLFPNPAQTTAFDAALTQSLSGINPFLKSAGVAWGETCAADILALRSNDKSTLVVPLSLIHI